MIYLMRSYHVLVSRSEDTKYQLYRYDPSLVASILFSILFFITTSLHGYQLFRTRTWFFIPFLLGGVCEVGGYVFRTINAHEAQGQWTIAPFIAQSLLTLVAPALFAASIYMELGRVVELVDGDRHLFIRRKWMTVIFVTGDVISFFVQGGGGGLMGSSKLETVQIGEKIIVGALFIQIFFFGIFVLAGLLFYSRMHKHPTVRGSEVPWKKHMFAMFFVSTLILIRSIFRVVEFLQGNNGYLLHSEVYLYVFDAALMLLVMLYMHWIHPSEIRSYMIGGPWAQGLRIKASVYDRGLYSSKA